MTTKKVRQVNETLNDIIENFNAELRTKIGEVTTPKDLITDVLKSCCSDGFISTSSIDLNATWVENNGLLITRMFDYLLNNYGLDVVRDMINIYANKGVARYVVDIYFWVLEWFFKTYDVYGRLVNALGLRDDNSEFEVTEYNMLDIEVAFDIAVLIHGDNDLF